MATGSQTTEATTNQVLEFALGEETYCVSIDYVTEIVDVGELTTVPNAPRHVEGVMDLRGRTTSIVDPGVVFGVDGHSDSERIIVYDPAIVDEQGAVGWLVGEVSQVVEVDPENVDPTPGNDDEAIHGVVKRDDGFVIWVDPEAVHA
jgi:purine-binding chemotaxis protein CheW